MTAPTLGDVMRAYAEDAVKLARREIEVDLDYSAASLADVDRLLDQVAPGRPLDASRLSAEDGEVLWTFCKLVGGYVREVIIRTIGGEWQIEQLDAQSGAISIVTTGGVRGHPPDSVWRALTEPHKSMASFYRALLVALDRIEPR